MKQVQMIQSLRKEVSTNKTASAVFHVFAFRKRARQILTVNGLRQKMRAEGFKYEDKEYAKVLASMAEAGVGTLTKDAKGRVKALKDIKITLTSLGKAVCGTNDKLKNFKPKNQFIEVEVPVIASIPAVAPTQSLSTASTMKIGVYTKNRLINVEVPTNLSAEELSSLVRKINEVA